MKTVQFIKTSFVALLISGMISCDKIEEGDYLQEAGSVNAACEEVSFTSRTSPVRKVLLEDYTGHQCGNCPSAAVKVHDIAEMYEGQVVSMAVHAGGFAELGSDGKYDYDFTTEPGNEYDAFFKISTVGNPNGMVNRIGYSDNHIQAPFKWQPLIGSLITQAPDADIQINAVYNEEISQICIDTYYEYLNSMEGDYRLVVHIVENDIESWQKNYEGSAVYPSYPTGDVPNYIHQHVLRANANGLWGADTKAASAGTSGVLRYSIELGDDWVKDNLEIVAYIYNAETFEVVQAEKGYVDK